MRRHKRRTITAEEAYLILGPRLTRRVLGWRGLAFARPEDERRLIQECWRRYPDPCPACGGPMRYNLTEKLTRAPLPCPTCCAKRAEEREKAEEAAAAYEQAQTAEDAEAAMEAAYQAMIDR